MNKKPLSKYIAIGIYLNYYFLTKISLFGFPLIAIYAILFNRAMVSNAIPIGICTYCLYFQELLDTNYNLKTNSFVNIVCIAIGVICLQLAWTDFFVHLIGIENFNNFVDRILMIM